MNRLLNATLRVVCAVCGTFLLMYFAGAFFNANFSIVEWTQESRLGVVIAWVSSSVFALMILFHWGWDEE